MYRLTKKQMKVLTLYCSGIPLAKMKTYHISAPNDAFERAQNNLNAAIGIIDLAVRKKWLDRRQIQRLRKIAEKA